MFGWFEAGETISWWRKGSGVTSVRSVPCCSAQPQGPPPAWPGRAVPEPDQKRWDGPKPISIVGSTGSIGTQVPIHVLLYEGIVTKNMGFFFR